MFSDIPTFFFKKFNHFLSLNFVVVLAELSTHPGTPLNFIRIAMDLNPVVAIVSYRQHLVQVLLVKRIRVSAVAAS